jgi:hypothetical protein
MNSIDNITAADMQATQGSGNSRRALMASGKKAKSLATKGRMGDTEMAHVTVGEVVLPLSVQTPEVMSVVSNAFEEIGVPMERYVVGSDENSINPETGMQEHGLGSLFKKVVSVAAPIVGNALLPGGGGAMLGNIAAGLIGGGGQQAQAGGAGGGAAPGGGYGAPGLNLPSPTTSAVELEKAQGPAVRSPFDSVTSMDSGNQTGAPGDNMVSGSSFSQPTQLTKAASPTASLGGGDSGGDLNPLVDALTKLLKGGVSSFGYPEFFDVNSPGASNSMNPRTGMKEFYGTGKRKPC